ncbi:MAG: phage portal protein [Phycisphaerae bacterium]|nr:phage portal protein [Phycisphaerae bacterium]
MMQWLLRHFGYDKRQSSGTYQPAQWFVDVITGGKSAAGLRVSQHTAMTFTPFWAAVRIISGTLASLPMILYRRNESGGRQRYQDHPVYDLLHNRPNPYMDPVTFIETRQAHVLTYGNGYAEIQRDGAGRPIALWPLLPDRTERKMSDDGTPYYEVWDAKARQSILRDDQVLHIKGLGFDGYTGYDVVRYHREALGYGMGVKQYASTFFANDASPGGVLTYPGALSQTAKEGLRKSWEGDRGLSDTHRMRVLEEGMKWEPMGVEPQKAQALETQKFTISDVSRIFNIPPHKLGDLERATYSNIEEQNIDFVTMTMYYWFRKWEQEINAKLFNDSERKSLFVEILVDGLLRGNVESRAKSYANGRQWGYYSINDIRRFENLNPIGPAGDVYLDPMNMRPAGSPAEQPQTGEGPDDSGRAFVMLLANTWRRVIRKQNRELAGKTNGAWDKHRDWSRRILRDGAMAAAAAQGVDAQRVEAALAEMVATMVRETVPLTEKDAETMAQMTLARVTGESDGLQA